MISPSDCDRCGKPLPGLYLKDPFLKGDLCPACTSFAYSQVERKIKLSKLDGSFMGRTTDDDEINRQVADERERNA